MEDNDVTQKVGEALLANQNKIMNNSDIKRHLISAATTFVSTFLVTIAMVVRDPSFTFSQEALYALAFSAVLAGVRGVAKLVIEWNLGQ